MSRMGDMVIAMEELEHELRGTGMRRLSVQSTMDYIGQWLKATPGVDAAVLGEFVQKWAERLA